MKLGIKLTLTKEETIEMAHRRLTQLKEAATHISEEVERLDCEYDNKADIERTNGFLSLVEELEHLTNDYASLFQGLVRLNEGRLGS